MVRIGLTHSVNPVVVSWNQQGEPAASISNLAKLLINQWGGKNVEHSGKRINTRSQSVQGL